MPQDISPKPCQRIYIEYRCGHPKNKTICSHAQGHPHNHPWECSVAGDPRCCTRACCEERVKKSDELQHLIAVETQLGIPRGGVFAQRAHRDDSPSPTQDESNEQRREGDQVERRYSEQDEEDRQRFESAWIAWYALKQQHAGLALGVNECPSPGDES